MWRHRAGLSAERKAEITEKQRVNRKIKRGALKLEKQGQEVRIMKKLRKPTKQQLVAQNAALRQQVELLTAIVLKMKAPDKKEKKTVE